MQRAEPWGRVLLFGLIIVNVLASLAAIGGASLSGWAIFGGWLALLIWINVAVMLPSLGTFARPIMGVLPARARGKLALTFDDGPHPTETLRILDKLDENGHKATFFIVGARAEENASVIAEIVKRGHTLANHSYRHSRATPFTNPNELADDLARVNDLIRTAQGKVTRWFRPPIGLISPRVRKAAELAGLELVGWTAKARDGWESTTVAAAARRLIEAMRPGAILLMHDGTEKPGRKPIAADVLPKVLYAMKELGLRSVTLDELLDGAAEAPTS